jgi:acetyl esterase/lipase
MPRTIDTPLTDADSYRRASIDGLPRSVPVYRAPLNRRGSGVFPASSASCPINVNKSAVCAPCALFAAAFLALGASGAQLADVPLPASFLPSMEVSTFPLWEGGAPGALGGAEEDVPTLTVFLPAFNEGNGTAVIIAPGGAYRGLAMNHEGRQVADWFTERKVTPFVLKYRLGPKYLYPVPLRDAQRAVRLVRSLQRKYNLAADRVGMVGFSAGGHLTAMTGTSFDGGRPDAADPVERFSSRPDFLVLGYPWINAMQPAKAGMIESYQTLMNIPKEKQAALEELYTPTRLVTPQTPPAFIFSTTDDNVVPSEASIEFYGALRKAGVSAELHLFRHGAHGVGLGKGDAALEQWPVLLAAWLRDQGLLSKAAPPK